MLTSQNKRIAFVIMAALAISSFIVLSVVCVEFEKINCVCEACLKTAEDRS